MLLLKIPVFRVVCAPLSWSTGQNPNGKVGLEGFRTAICTGKGFHIKCDISASAGNLLIFLSGCAAYRLLYKQTRTKCSNSVCKAIAMLANPAKICQRSALGSGDIRTFDYGKLSICANGPFYFVGIVFCWTIYQTKERVKFNVFSKFASFIRT